VEKFHGARKATHDSIMWHMHFTCWLNDVMCMHARTQANTHTEICNAYCFSIAAVNAPQFYILCTLPLLFMDNMNLTFLRLYVVFCTSTGFY
jgi:hypothetical protein